MRWYNKNRIEISLGALRPMEYESALNLRQKPDSRSCPPLYG
ncbi:hypothetical protein [Acidovorax sp. JMULE5]